MIRPLRGEQWRQRLMMRGPWLQLRSRPYLLGGSQCFRGRLPRAQPSPRRSRHPQSRKILWHLGRYPKQFGGFGWLAWSLIRLPHQRRRVRRCRSLEHREWRYVRLRIRLHPQASRCTSWKHRSFHLLGLQRLSIERSMHPHRISQLGSQQHQSSLGPELKREQRREFG